MRRRYSPSGMTLVVALAAIISFALLAVPLVIQVVTAFRGRFLPFGVPEAKWTTSNFQALWELRADFWNVIGTTAVFVIGSMAIAMTLAFALAWVVVRTDSPFRRIIPVLVIVPYIIPPIVKAQAYLLMLAPGTGVVNQALSYLPGLGGDGSPIDPYAFSMIVIIQGLNFVTFPFLLLVPALTSMDGGLEEAARTSGASWSQTLRKVTLPVLWPGMLGIAVLTAILSLGSLEIPLLFGQQSGRNIFALKLWNLINASAGSLPQYGLASAWGMVFLAITSVAFWLYLRATKNAEKRASISGKGFRPRRLTLGRARIPVLIGVGVYVLVTAVLPLLALLWSAITLFPVAFSVQALTSQTSLGAFPTVLQDTTFWASLGRTIIIAAGSSTIAVVVATILAYRIARSKRGRGAKVIDLMASSSVAIPATIAGFASFLLYLSINKWVPLSGTVLSMVLAYSYRLSISYRTSYSATLQVGRELEEVALTSGASRLQTFRKVVAPLLLPSVVAIWIQLFILGANEFTLPAFLATPSSQPLSTYVYALINPRAGGLYAPDRGAAMALLFTLFVALVGYALQVVQNRRSVAGGAPTHRKKRAAGAGGFTVDTGDAPQDDALAPSAVGGGDPPAPSGP